MLLERYCACRGNSTLRAKYCDTTKYAVPGVRPQSRRIRFRRKLQSRERRDHVRRLRVHRQRDADFEHNQYGTGDH
ncbi:hypothetical protein DPMN_137638 [Dreissena polymorpha]|uniref:Uncharacterized protein n=1 Tax=Dreissena polymorpha TaxID=45954 RepID=A0A9D4G343_DREPO|nr:hypothetical protein DPMN_137638 [Dreissena polymorpha]